MGREVYMTPTSARKSAILFRRFRVEHGLVKDDPPDVVTAGGAVVIES